MNGAAMMRIAVLGDIEGSSAICERLVAAGLDVVLVHSGVDRRSGTEIPGLHVTHDVAQAAGVQVLLVRTPGPVEVVVAAITAMLPHLPAEALIAIDRSDISVTEVAHATPVADRVVGLHLVLFAHAPGLAEIVRWDGAPEGPVTEAVALAETLSIAHVVTDDRPGLLIDRVLLPYLNQAIDDLDGGIGSAEDVDLAIRLGLGYPAGPFELLEKRGLEHHRTTTSAIASTTGSRYFAAPPVLQRLVAAGRTGTGAFSPVEGGVQDV